MNCDYYTVECFWYDIRHITSLTLVSVFCRIFVRGWYPWYWSVNRVKSCIIQATLIWWCALVKYSFLVHWCDVVLSCNMRWSAGRQVIRDIFHTLVIVSDTWRVLQYSILHTNTPEYENIDMHIFSHTYFLKQNLYSLAFLFPLILTHFYCTLFRTPSIYRTITEPQKDYL